MKKDHFLYRLNIQIPESFENATAQKDFIVTSTLLLTIIPLAIYTIIMAILTLMGRNNNTRWLDLLIMCLIVFCGLVLVWVRRVKLARYLVVTALFGYSLWVTYQVGFSSVGVLGYVITLLMIHLIIDRRTVFVAAIVIVPALVYVFFQPYELVNPHNLVAYTTMITAIGLLLGLLVGLKDRTDRDLQVSNAIEAAQQAGVSVLSTLNLQETIHRILEELKNIVPHDSASVLLLREGNQLEIVGGSGWDNPEEVIGITFPIPGDNPNSVVIETGQPHILGNAPDEFPPFTQEPHSHILSWLGVPLIEGGKIIGMMAIDSSQPNHFSEEHVRVVTIFADHVAVAIENALLYEIANQAIRRRSILYTASQDVITARADLEKIYSSIHKAAEQLMPCEAFVIALLDESGEHIDGAYLIDKGGRDESIRVPLGEGLSGQVIATGNKFLVDDLLEDKEIDGRHFGHQDQVRSLVAVPFSTGDQVIGMLSAQSYQVAAYTPDDLELLELLAAYAGIAIQNARLLARMEHMANTDSMTGLLNRRAFDRTLAEEIERVKRYGYYLSLMIIDIDDFKQFNDEYGHSRGDDHLKSIAAIIRQTVRNSDLPARIGGEEFSVIMPHTSRLGAQDLAERIRRRIEHTFFEVYSVGHTVSIGVAEYPLDAGSLDSLFDAADKAMFLAKRHGKNQVRTPTQHGGR
jgi:diguanylate cyclase (GGDEF)-like protein